MGRPKTIKIMVYADAGNEWRWRMTVNGRTMAVSGEAYASKGNAKRAAERMSVLVPSSEVRLP